MRIGNEVERKQNWKLVMEIKEDQFCSGRRAC